MASTRKTQRQRQSADQANSPQASGTPSNKRRKKDSPLSSSTSPTLDGMQTEQIYVSSESVMTFEDSQQINVVEELVTVDVTEYPDIETVHNTEALTSSSCMDTNENLNDTNIPISQPADDSIELEKPASTYIFKDPNFVHSSKNTGGNKKTRIWKNLKQIIAAERALPWEPNTVTYGSIDAPPSFKPSKKYSDISGLESKYTDPQTRMRYANVDEYRRIKMLPADIITGCLALRKANNPVP